MRDLLVLLYKVTCGIVFVPLHVVLSVLTRVMNWKHATIQLQITYVSGEAFITSHSAADGERPEYFILAYLLFLSQYFYACDKRQVTPVAKCLGEHVEHCNPPAELAGSLLRTVRATLNQRENDALAGLFRDSFLPPLVYSEGITSMSKIARHTMMIYKRGDLWSIDLRISFAMSTFLFPLTVGILYHYVSDKVGYEKKEVLDSCIMQVLTSQGTSDFRGLREGARLLVPNTIIAENLKM